MHECPNVFCYTSPMKQTKQKEAVTPVRPTPVAATVVISIFFGVGIVIVAIITFTQTWNYSISAPGVFIWGVVRAAIGVATVVCANALRRQKWWAALFLLLPFGLLAYDLSTVIRMFSGGVYALPSSLTWLAATVRAVVWLPVYMMVVLLYYTWRFRFPSVSKKYIHVARVILAVCAMLTLCTPIATYAKSYVYDRTGHELRSDFTFAWRYAEIDMDNDRQTYVYVTDISPERFLSEFSGAKAAATDNPSAAITDVRFTKPASSDSERVYSVRYCTLRDTACRRMLHSRSPFNANALDRKTYAVSMDEWALQSLSESAPWR